jgi:hypothetical protein
MSRAFNGAVSGSYLENASAAFPSGNDNLAICAWIYPTSWGAASGNGPGWILNCGGTGSNACGMYVSKSATGGGGTLSAIITNKIVTASEAVSVDSVLVLNQWQFVVFQWSHNSGLSRLWVNGVEVQYALQMTGNGSNPSGSPTIIGNGATSGTASGFTGYIDSVAIFSTVPTSPIPLSNAQIIAAMGYQGVASIQSPFPAYNYWPLLGTTSPEPDIYLNTNYPLTVSNSTQGPNSPGQQSPQASGFNSLSTGSLIGLSSGAGTITVTSPLTVGLSSYWNGVANSQVLTISGSYENSPFGSGFYSQDSWTIQNVIGAGSNGTSTLTFAHVGTSGAATISVPSITSGSVSSSVLTSSTGFSLTQTGNEGTSIADSGGGGILINATGTGATLSLNPGGKPTTVGGILTVEAGTVSAPALGFVGATSTGLYLLSGVGSPPEAGIGIAIQGVLVAKILDSGSIINGVSVPAASGNSTFTQTIASGVATLGTTQIASGASSSAVTVSAPGVVSTDNVMADFNTDPLGITGFEPSTSGMLTIVKWCSANAVNFRVYNNTANSIAPTEGSPPTGVVLNWRVVR